MKRLTIYCTLFMVCHQICAHQLQFNHGIKLPTTRPLIVGHRGSAGTHPEHTIPGFQQAIDDGADLIECDVLITKDLELVCLHDPYLSHITDVQEHPEFTDRKRNVSVPDYGTHDDWFCWDFTLAELKTLRVKQRETFRDQSYDWLYGIPTLAEYIQVAQRADRPIGIYPELKLPQMINTLDIIGGKRYEDLFLEALASHGYTNQNDACFIQSFSDESLRYMKQNTDLRLVMLVWKDVHILGSHLNDSKIQEWGQLFYGLGAWKVQIVNYYDDVKGYKTWISGRSGLLEEAKNAGLKVHLYTYRNEDKFLAWDFKQDPINEYIYSFDMDVDGYFTDFPATLKRALDLEYGPVRHGDDVEMCTGSAAWAMSHILNVLAAYAVTLL